MAWWTNISYPPNACKGWVDRAITLRSFVRSVRAYGACTILFCLCVSFSEECLVNLVQVIGSSQESGASRVVGTQRIVVELGVQRLRVLVQYRSKRRWMISDPGGSIRYLNGVLRDADGSWVVACADLAALVSVAHCLPAGYQHLLAPESDDWQPLKERKSACCFQAGYTP